MTAISHGQWTKGPDNKGTVYSKFIIYYTAAGGYKIIMYSISIASSVQIINGQSWSTQSLYSPYSSLLNSSIIQSYTKIIIHVTYCL